MPAINKPNQHFDISTWTGDGSQTKSITGLNFQPDLVWNKIRTGTTQGTGVFDSIRGTTGQSLDTAAVTAEGTWNGAASSDYGYVSSFNTDGFSMNDGAVATTGGYVNYSARTYVAWQWKAGGTAVTNTSGTISSQVSANPTAGFSIVSWTGNGSSSATVGHGLGAVPAMIICKERSGTDYWHVKHKSLSSTYNVFLNVTNAQTSASSVGDGVLGDLSSNTTFGFATAGSPGNVVAVNENGITNIAYCWAEIPGYSAFGSYTGNSSTDGPFVYTGFRPRWVLVKDISTDSPSGSSQWRLWDTSRATYNVMDNTLQPNGTNTEQTSVGMLIDSLSNGFKLRDTNKAVNQSSDTYIYAAFAEAPFKYANAR